MTYEKRYDKMRVGYDRMRAWLRQNESEKSRIGIE
jgi:hypothetical protein